MPGANTSPVQSSPFALILTRVVAQLANRMRVNPALVRPVLSDKYAVTGADTVFAYVQVLRPVPLTDSGAGRFGRPVSRRLRVYYYLRAGSDQYGGDEYALYGDDPSAAAAAQYASAATPSMLLLEEVVLDALDDFAPLAPTGPARMLTVEPVHVLPDGGPPERKPEDDDGLLRGYADFEVRYLLSLSRGEPAPAYTAPAP